MSDDTHVKLELDDIQRRILSLRPTPYAATYILFRIDDRDHGRELMRRASVVVTSAADTISPLDETWVSVALTYHGLKVLGVRQEWLDAFAWESPLGTPDVHVVLVALAPR